MTIWHAGEFAQAATYWAPPTTDGYGGQSWPAPVAIRCRWEESTEKVINQYGEEITSQAVIWPSVYLQAGGWLYLGTSVVADPRNQVGAFMIQRRALTPALTGDLEEHKVWI